MDATRQTRYARDRRWRLAHRHGFSGPSSCPHPASVPFSPAAFRSTFPQSVTRSLNGQRLGVVGLGHIGEAVARRAEALRMAVKWWGPRDKVAAWPRAGSLLELARDSDILVVACKADDGNVGLVSREVIEALGPDGLLVNVARGQLVDEAALIAALKDGRLGQAALDVFEDEPTEPARWADAPNTVLTPHTGGATTEAVQGMLRLLMQNLEAAFAGEPLKTPAPEN